MRRFSAHWKAGITFPALPREEGRRGGRCPPAPAHKRGAAGPVRGTEGAADEAHHCGALAESSPQNWGSAYQRSLTCEQKGGSQQHAPGEQLAGHGPACGNAGLFPCRRRRGRSRGAGWAPTGSPRSRALPTAAEITAKRGAESASSSPRVLPARPGPTRPAEREYPLRAALPASPPTGIRYPPAPASLIYNFSTPRRAPLHPPPPTSSAGSTPSPGRGPRSPSRPAAGTVSLPRGSPAPGRSRPPGSPAVPSGRSPDPGCFQPPWSQRCQGGQRDSSLARRRAPLGRAFSGLAIPGTNADRWGPGPAELLFGSAGKPRQRRVPSPAAGPGPFTAAPRLPGAMLGAPKSAARAPGARGSALLFAFPGEREPEGDCSVRGLIQTSRIPSRQH